jgi:hypothetical protein
MKKTYIRKITQDIQISNLPFIRVEKNTKVEVHDIIQSDKFESSVGVVVKVLDGPYKDVIHTIDSSFLTFLKIN